MSGNLSFLNWLTALPAIWCLDDQFLSRFVSSSTVNLAAKAREGALGLVPTSYSELHLWLPRLLANLLLAGLIGTLSFPVIRNLFSKHQIMNMSFDQWHIVNTYGAFGTVTKDRYEVIVEGTDDYKGKDATVWKEYVFKVKPGPTDRRPPIISPYHYRLDWLAWFLPFYSGSRLPSWFTLFLNKLLKNDPSTLSLLAHNPFPETPPKYVRASLYLYRFAKPGSPEAHGGQWWTRSFVGPYYPFVGLSDMAPRLVALGYADEAKQE